MLASWLFAQYLLTNEVQIAYARTEGYVPVTSKAQEAEEYRDYLNAAGTDDTVHYDVKIAAARLLLENMDNTFVTPVFNGSASLRDAAGQMIESVTKSIKRKQTVDEAYLRKLYGDVASLYRLDLGGGRPADGENVSGGLPGTAVILLSSLAIVWAGLIFMGIRGFIRKKKQNKP